MTQLHLTISSEDIQSLIKESVDNKIARDILTKLFNQLMEKVRENRRVVSKACHIAIGISEKGKREILGLDISQGETVSSWYNFFEYLKKEGYQDLRL